MGDLTKSLPASSKAQPEPKSRPQLPKAPTGIKGLDEITGGGFPKRRPTLVCGPTGCGKTVLAMEFLVCGATQFNEPGIFIAFEETTEDLTQNVMSLSFDLQDLISHKKIILDFVYIEHNEIETSGEYDLEGLFIRLGLAIDAIGAKRVVLDTIESLFSGLPDPLILRAELRRLFRWLKEKGVTAVITAERGEGIMTRYGLEEYVSDCVIELDHRVTNQIPARRLRVIKYRGSTHGANEYPFLIDEDGIMVMPVTSLRLQHIATTDRISTGIAQLDGMLGGKGYYRGSTILFSGAEGTGKTSVASHFAEAACRRGERVLFFSFEESPCQIMRNMRSIGIDLEQWEKNGLLQLVSTRSTFTGLEMHLMLMHKTIDAFKAQVVIMDPLNSFVAGGNENDVKLMLLRLLDYLKINQITGFFTNLTSGGSVPERITVAISSIIDTWLLVRNLEDGGERNRGLYILKSRDMAHSNQVREFMITNHGVELLDVYIGPEGVLTGSARLAHAVQEQAAQLAHQQEIEGRKLELDLRRKILEAQIEFMRSEFAMKEAEMKKTFEQDQAHETQQLKAREDMGRPRTEDAKNN